MEQREAAGIVVTASDFSRKKLARQLDFEAMCRPSTNAILPEHPQARLESKLIALAQLQVSLRPSKPQSPPRPSQPQAPPPQSIPQAAILLQSQMQPKQPVLPVPRAARPAQPKPRPTLPDVMMESPKSQQRSEIEVKDGTPKKQKKCNCKNSRCLKLYCECFGLGIYCDGCNCTNCHNNVEHDAARQKAVGATLERDPNAFRPKILNSPHTLQDEYGVRFGPKGSRFVHIMPKEEAGEVTVTAKHKKGCNCKKSGCLKKYCECFQANIVCSENCKCMDCKNSEGSEERMAFSPGDHGNYTSYFQKAANATINGAIGTSPLGTLPASKKKKSQQLIFGENVCNHSIRGIAQFQQENNFRAPVASSSMLSSPVSCIASATSLGSSKLTYKSSLADVIRSQDIKELCSLLVVASAEATKAIAGGKGKINKQRDQLERSIGSSAAEIYCQIKDNVQTSVPADHLSVNRGRADDSGSDESDARTRRPMSPATLALMCDEEHDAMLLGTGSHNAAPNCDGNMTNNSSQVQTSTELYAEQERIVLTNFRNFLTRIITHGSIKVSEASALH